MVLRLALVVGLGIATVLGIRAICKRGDSKDCQNECDGLECSDSNNPVNMLKFQTRLIDLSKKIVVIRAKAMLDERHDAVAELWLLKGKLDDLVNEYHESLREVGENLVHDGQSSDILALLEDLRNLEFGIEADDALFMEKVGSFCDNWLEITDKIVNDTRKAFEVLSSGNM